MYKDVHCKPSKVGRSDHVPLEPFRCRPHYGSPRLVEQSELIRRAVIVQPVPPGRDAAAKAKRCGAVCRHFAFSLFGKVRGPQKLKGKASGALISVFTASSGLLFT
jgi:hypothetical protein